MLHKADGVLMSPLHSKGDGSKALGKGLSCPCTCAAVTYPPLLLTPPPPGLPPAGRRPRHLVRLWCDTHCARGGLPGDAVRGHGLHDQALWLLLWQPWPGYPTRRKYCQQGGWSQRCLLHGWQRQRRSRRKWQRRSRRQRQRRVSRALIRQQRWDLADRDPVSTTVQSSARLQRCLL